MVCSFWAEFAEKGVVKKEIKEAVGIDLGLNEIATLSTGEKIANPRWVRGSEKKLAKEQRRLSRRKKGSNSRKEQKKVVAKTHRRIRNQRRDFHHKISRKLADTYDLIVFEALKVKNMVKNKYLARSILDAGWNQLICFVSYKAEEAGKRVERVNPSGTSQLCSSCGIKVQKSLAVRTHKCPHCGLVMDRDENAAINILSRGLDTVGTTGRACMSSLVGDAMIQEATQLLGW